jgi:hypothetical protein
LGGRREFKIRIQADALKPLGGVVKDEAVPVASRREHVFVDECVTLGPAEEGLDAVW